MQGGQDKSLSRLEVELFVVSALILFLELALIRWIGTQIRVFAYLGNLILVVCFFGGGLGCYRAQQPVSLTRLGVNLLIIVVLVANPLRLEALDFRFASYLLGGFEDSPVWHALGGRSVVEVLAGLVIVGVLTYLVTFAFVPAGQVLGRVLSDHPQTIRAYSINIAGSLAGVWAFNALSWAALPPPVWFGVVTGLVVVLVAARG